LLKEGKESYFKTGQSVGISFLLGFLWWTA